MDANYNYYDILEVSQHSSQKDVSTAYERLRTTFSGENPAIYSIFSEKEAREYLALVEEAYSVLGNKTLRAIYDDKFTKVEKVVDLSFDSLNREALTQKIEPAPVQRVGRKTLEYMINQELEERFKKQTEWSGAQLKEVREYKNASLEKLSEITKITAFYIDAIEKMETQNLPALVFVRGYVVQIAKTLGLNDKTVAHSYMEIYKAKLGLPG